MTITRTTLSGNPLFSDRRLRMAGFNKVLAQYFFSKGPDNLDGPQKKNIFKCRSNEIVGRDCCSIKNFFTVIAKAGFTNLKNHLKECVPDYEALYAGREQARNVRNHPVGLLLGKSELASESFISVE